VRIAFWAGTIAALIIAAVAAYATLGPRAPERFKAVDVTGVALLRLHRLPGHVPDDARA
jgi:hypothetical protein